VATHPTRICVIGDELVAGVSDPRGLGWVGRVAARTEVDPRPEFYQLAVPGETSSGLFGRWESEVDRRWLPDADNRLVISLGTADITADLSLARSRLNLANILDTAAARRIPTLVVGPPPANPEDGPQIAELSAAFQDVAQRRRVPFVDTYTPLAPHDQWNADTASNDRYLPSQAGYGLMAWLVLHSGWHEWLGQESSS